MSSAEKISSIGYFELPDYDEPAFIIAGQQFYRVVEGFPRLVRSSLPGWTGPPELLMSSSKPSKAFKCSDKEVWA